MDKYKLSLKCNFRGIFSLEHNYYVQPQILNVGNKNLEFFNILKIDILQLDRAQT